MAYKITQHRRGKLEEWQSLNPVPFEGELIIVEFEGNIRKCKIGDGDTAFIDLPYITDWLSEELIAKIDALQTLTANNLSTEVADLKQKIADAETEFAEAVGEVRTDLEAKVAKVTFDVNELASEIDKVDGVVKTLVEPAVGALDAKYSDELNRIAEQHTADISTLNTTIETKVAELSATIENASTTNTTNFNSTLNTTKAELIADYEAKVVAVENRLRTDLNEVESALDEQSKAIEDIQEDFADLAAAVDTKINDKVTDSEDSIRAEITDILESIEAINTSIEQLQDKVDFEQNLPSFSPSESLDADETLTALVSQLDSLQYKVSTLERDSVVSATDLRNVNTELARLSNSLANLAAQQKSGSDTLIKTIGDLDTRLSKAMSDISATTTAHAEEVNKDIAKLKTDDLINYREIYKVNDALVKKLEAGDSAISDKLGDEVTKLTKKINDTKTTVNTKLTQIQTATAEGITNAKTELTKKIDDLEALYSSQTAGSTETLRKLEDRVAANYLEVTSAVEAVEADILSNKVSITNNSSTINQVATTLDTKVSAINASLDTLNTRLDTQVVGAENRLQTQIDAIDGTLQIQTQGLAKVRDDLTALDADLDSRIADQLLDSKNEINSELIGIRESIRQINITLELLGSNPGNGSNANGNLTLLTEQLADLQRRLDSLEDTSVSASAELQILNVELAGLATSITNALDQQKASSEALTKAITDAETKASKADSDIISIVTANNQKTNEELADLAADDILLYQIIYRIRDELLNKVNTTSTNLQTALDTNVANLSNSLADTKTAIGEQLAQTQEALSEAITQAEGRLESEINRIDVLYNSKTATNKSAINELRTTVSSNQTKLASDLEAITTDIEENKTDIAHARADLNQINSTLENKVALINSGIENLDGRLASQNNRIDKLVAFDLNDFTLKEGEITKEDFTKLAQEVADIRNGYNGETYESAQAAVQAIGDNLAQLQSSLSQYVGTEAINGLYYDTKGEVGLMQPYMLYLKTADNKVIQNSGVQIIGGAGVGPSGGSSSLAVNYDARSPQEIKVTPSNDEVKIYFTFSGTDSSGDPIRTASATWRVDDVVVERGTVKSGENYFDVTKYIKEGTINVHLTVTDGTPSIATKAWEVELINLKLESDFSDKKTYSPGETITFSFKPTGAVEKEAIFILDGEELIIPGKFPMSLAETDSGTTKYCDLPLLEHGSHLLEVYLKATVSGIDVESDPIFKDIICFDASDKKKPAVIGVADQTLTVDQYSTTNIVYTVYSNTTDTPTVDITVDGITTTNIVKPNKDYSNTPTAIYSYVATTPGTHSITISCEGINKVIDVFVKDLGITITPVTTGLAFDFNPAGKNNPIDKNNGAVWSDQGVNLTVSDNFDWTNGGFLPNDPDGPCFCVKAGSTATISHKLFEKDGKDGKEFKLVFKTKNVANPDAVFLSCLDSETDPSRVGLQMGVQGATLYGKSDKLELVYSEEDVIEFEFNISQYSDAENALNMVMGYEDGVPSRPMIYDSSYSFKHDSDDAKPITIGSPDCDVYIYRLKVYNISLDTADILNNFIADARTAKEMVNRYQRNQIYDKNNKLTPESIAVACPWLRVIKISAPKFTSSKKDDITKTTIQQIYGQGRPEDNWIAYDAVHSGQGTSSDNYGAAGRNIDLKVRIVKDKNDNPINTNPYFLYTDEKGENKIVDKVSLTDTSIPVDYFNIKVNIASSNNLTNAIIAKHYNEFNPYKRPYVRDDASIIPYLKDTMEFYNCVVFVQETDTTTDAKGNYINHREFNDTGYHFYAIGNIGDSKKTDKTRLTDPSDKHECCVEIMDVGLPLSAFPKDTMVAGHYIDDDGNVQITWSNEENLCKLYEFIDGSYVKTPDTSIDSNKTYYIYTEGKYIEASEGQLTTKNLGILYEREYYVSTDTQIDLNKTYYIDSTSFIRVPTNELTDYSIAELYERVYVRTEDEAVVQNKKYYTEIGVRIKDEALRNINPKEAGLYEWTGEHIETNDSSFILDKGYYTIIADKKSAMEYTTVEVDSYIFATNENLANHLLYECEFTKTTDETVSIFKYYYIDANGTMLLASGEDLQESNLENLYECTPAISQDSAIDYSKTYYTRVEEFDESDELLGAYYVNAMGTTKKTVKVYTYATQENLDKGILYEVSYHKSLDTAIAAVKNKTYFVDILENDDFSENYTYGWRYISDEEDPEIVNTCKQAWIDFYRFVTTSTDEEFKANLKNYFVEDSALYYYLFTTRYCMVDNRAKNTFWHYGKTSDGTRKWDLCWDYDNDTSLGLNNYGAQVYRYGLEDTDQDASGEEVFRQSDSLFFCRIRDLFDAELKNMYQTLETDNAWDADTFITECDAWQEQFPEELWRIDIERKYIRTYTKSFINGAGDKQFLRTMANGRMKYHRRQWERNQEQYMASKYQTTVALGDAAHANFRVGRPSGDLVVSPSYRFTLTPYSHIYLNVQYGGASPISVRATPNVPTPIPYAGASADIINVGSAAAISDFGDLSTFYPKTASVQNATRIKKLKLGNNTPGYSNTIFQTLDTGNNTLLEELDLTNITSYTRPLDLQQLINLKKLYAAGTGISSVSFAVGGKLSYAELPAVNNITLKNLIYLNSANFMLSSYENVTDLIIEGCPGLDQITLLNNCLSATPESSKLKKVRLDNIRFGEISYAEFASKMFKLKGLSPTGNDLDNAAIVGTVHFSDDVLTGEQYNQVKSRYPDLEVSYNKLKSVLKFMCVDNETELCCQEIEDGKDGTVLDAEYTDRLIKAPSENGEFTYNWVGWSTEPNSAVVDDNALKNVEGDRTLYPVFKQTKVTYEVRFINPTIDDETGRVLYTTQVPYGQSPDTEYPAHLADPENEDDVTINKLYTFVGWATETGEPLGVVTGALDCYAQFAVKDQDGENDADDGDTLPGYTLGKMDVVCDSATATITKCINTFNSAIRVPEKIDECSIEKIGVKCFEGHKNLELIYLPASLKEIQQSAFRESNLVEFNAPEALTTIGSYAFRTCANLRTVNISAKVSSIGQQAFNECSALSNITVSASNNYYKTLQDGKILIETGTQTLKQGLNGATLDGITDITNLGAYCFYGKDIGKGFESITIPEGVTTISGWAFDGCKELTGVKLPSTLTKLDSNCFANTPLTAIELPTNLRDIGTTAFGKCHFTTVEIPAAVTKIPNVAFGNITELTTVIFRRNTPPEITERAFENSGAASGLTFYVPWNEDTHTNTFGKDFVWGAKNATIVYDYKEENT